MSKHEDANTAIEIVARWRGTIMQVAHLEPGKGRGIHEIGEDPRCDFQVGAEALGGADSFLLVDRKGLLRIPSTATEVVASIRGLSAQGVPEAQGGAGARLGLGDRVGFSLGEIRWEVRATEAEKRPRLPLSFDWQSLSFSMGSIALNIAFFGMVFTFPPDSRSLSTVQDFERSRWGRLLSEPISIEVDTMPDWMKAPPRAKKAPEGGDGQSHAGSEGQMGDLRSRKSDGMYSIKGNADPSERQLAKMTRAEVGETGILKLLAGTLSSPTSPYGWDEAKGSDMESYLGALMGATQGPNFGFGGLGMIGSGDGGAGTGEGTIGLGTGVWTKIGHGGGGGPDGVGYCKGGICGGGLDDKPTGKVPPKVEIEGKAIVNGCISKESIRRVIRQHLNEVKGCYESALQSRPDLAGHVQLTLVIGLDGTVSGAKIGSSTLGEPSVEQCIVKKSQKWTFPAPEGCGAVIVHYPYSFVPAGEN